MKKGFTLVEMIGVVAILVVLSLLLVPKVITIISSNNEKMYHEMENRLEEASLKYLLNHYTELDTITINKTDILNDGEIEDLLDLTDGTSCSGYVVITNINTQPMADAYIKCTNYETLGYTNK